MVEASEGSKHDPRHVLPLRLDEGLRIRVVDALGVALGTDPRAGQAFLFHHKRATHEKILWVDARAYHRRSTG